MVLAQLLVSAPWLLAHPAIAAILGGAAAIVTGVWVFHSLIFDLPIYLGKAFESGNFLGYLGSHKLELLLILLAVLTFLGAMGKIAKFLERYSETPILGTITNALAVAFRTLDENFKNLQGWLLEALSGAFTGAKAGLGNLLRKIALSRKRGKSTMRRNKLYIQCA